VQPRAVVFDLWETLVEWPTDESELVRRRWAELLGISLERLNEMWYDATAYRVRESGPLGPAVRALCAAVGSEVDAEELIAPRREMTRRALVPRDGAIDTLAELRRRGVRTGLISNCTEDLTDVWADGPLARSFDACVFSSAARCVKPDPEIYELACTLLDLTPTECLFVGDGANDELAGAARVGMTPVLFCPRRQAPRWDGLGDWTGLRITTVPEVLELLA
jgi:putative hydrolase of the HAD superfamily